MSTIQFLDKDKESGKIKFLLKDATPAIANSLRRAIIELTPTMAIENVDFVKNDSALYDEILAHRIGLIALTTDIKAYDLPQNCKCKGEGCAKCTLKLTLKTKGPCNVYAKDFKSQDPKVKPAQPETLLVKLLKGQELEIEATAILGRGMQHAKFTPGMVWYNYEPKITVNNTHPDFEKYKEKYPQQAFKDGKIDKKLIEELELYDTCDGINKDIVNIEWNKTSFIFNIEPWGQLSPKEMLQSAIEALNEKLEELHQKLE